jgi:SWIM zinc finger
MLTTPWDFRDEAINSTTQQINRQKSARNLKVQSIDPSGPDAVLFDPGRREIHTATLTQCDCRDFNFAGTSPRKTFKPCMHIYRLAIELGLVQTIYLDARAREAWAGPLAEMETQRLQQLPRDPSQWGAWAIEIHDSGIQHNRQYRAYSIGRDEADSVQRGPGGWTIHGYAAKLDRCSCMDFLARQLPCKHIYAAALSAGISLPLDYDSFEAAKNSGVALVFEFPTNT